MSGILVVEDEAFLAEELEETLQHLGYAVPAVARRGDEAIERAGNMQPDLVLMDINLAGEMDGIETALALRQRWNLPVIFLTGFTDDATMSRARAAGPEGYLVKPFRAAELHSAIEIALHRHAAEASLHERARRLESTLRSLGEAVIAADLHGRVTHLNPAAERLTGWRATEAEGAALTRVCPIERELVDDRGAYDWTGLRPITGGVLVTREGRRVQIEDAIAPIHDADESVIGLVLVLRDVGHERSQHEREAMAERLASIAALAGGLSHEINNPLACVIANLDFAVEDLALLARADLDDGVAPKTLTLEQAARLERIEQIRASLASSVKAAQRICRVVSELRGLADPPRGMTATIDLGAALTAAALVARSTVEERARLRVDVQGAPTVRGNRARLIQALTNLAVGAAHAIPPGNVEGHEVRLGARFDASGSVVIEVRDSGPALGPHAHRHLFDPFFSRSTSPEIGSLGMWHAHRVLTDLGATLRVESHGERGNRIIATVRAAN